MTIQYRFCTRRRTAANWTSVNEVLLLGEIGLETDTNRFKYGDGATVWNSLPYFDAGDIPIADVGTYFTGTDVEAALQELGAAIGSAGGGVMLGQAYTETNSPGSTNAIIPYDNTIPQNTEGAEFSALNTTYTPTSASSILEVEVMIPQYQLSTNANALCALFRDSDADAIAAANATPAVAGYSNILHLVRRVVAGSTSATTFKFRYGPNGGNMYLLRTSSSATFLGNVIYGFMRVTEYPP